MVRRKIKLPNVSILGSSGSIGQQALEVLESLGKDYRVVALTAHTNYSLLAEQARRFTPELLVLADDRNIEQLKKETHNINPKFAMGEEGLEQAATWASADIILMALVGFSGFRPTLAALKEGKRVALANKESLVVGGELLSRKFPRFREMIIPVDSEHSAVFQCLRGESAREVKRVILTASGGPFRGLNYDELEQVKPAQALKHPNWQMGAKITIDSATLMNKGFEVLEAGWLFGLGLDQIEVLVHPQSLVHSLVEFVDGSVVAQMAVPDMRLPIQYALTYPRREKAVIKGVEWGKQNLVFEDPDNQAFPCLRLAYRAGEIGGTMPACMNAVNEVAVQLFLDNKIKFTAIAEMIEAIMDEHQSVSNPEEEDILAAHEWAADRAINLGEMGGYRC